MAAEKNPHRNRHSIRLSGFDYSAPGVYFVTICAHNRIPLFGYIENGTMILNESGNIVAREWKKSGEMRPRVRLDAFVVMPDHFHGIVVLDGIADDRRGTLPRAPGIPSYGRGTRQRAPTDDDGQAHERFGKPTSDSIPTIIRLFKSSVTVRINSLRGTPRKPVWQRGYYERVIRDTKEFARVRRYIDDNPKRWEMPGKRWRTEQ